jgi:hypothetical protein
MSNDTAHDTAVQAEGTAAGDLLAQMVHDLGDTVTREIEQLRAEASERTAGAVKGARLLAGAGASGAVAVIAIGTLPILALRRVLPGWAVAVGVAGGAGALTAVLGRRGLAELGAATPGSDARFTDAARDAVRSVVA